MVEMYCIVKGKVQNVAYRAYVQDSAGKLGIYGFVRNLPDGTVEILAQGSPDVLKEFVEYLHEGSLLSKVENVSIDWRTAKKLLNDFSILHE
jgi:acylphosphatase